MCECKGHSPLVLASASPRRKWLLEQVGLEFDVVPADVEEVPDEKAGAVRETVRLAVDKAIWVAERLPPDRWVLSADTVVVIDGKILGKPNDEAEAVKMLETISGRTHNVITGWCIVKSPREIAKTGHVESRVFIKPLDRRTIEAYVKTGEPMDKAGAYAVQGIGAFMIKSIEGSYTNVVGLPLCEVVEALEELGVAKILK